MMMEKKKYVVIMAAGSGVRMGTDMPKQFLELRGKAVLQRTIEVFMEACPEISVVTVLPEQYIGYWKDYCYRNSFICPQILVKGGITRFHSVRNALARIPEGAVVAIHDGVRPLLSVQMVSEMFARAEHVSALIPVIPCVDTIKVLRKEKDEQGNETLRAIAGEVADRSVLYGAQTPQIFHSEILKSAYSLPFDTAFTDDASVVEKYGESLSYVTGERLNIKITTREDLLLAEAIMQLRDS